MKKSTVNPDPFNLRSIELRNERDEIRDVAIFLEGYRLGKGNILPLGSNHIQTLWKVAKEKGLDVILTAGTVNLVET